MRDFAGAPVLRASKASLVRRTKTGLSAETRSEAEGKIKADAKTGLRPDITATFRRRPERVKIAHFGSERAPRKGRLVPR